MSLPRKKVTKFGPRNKSEEIVFAEEQFRIKLQYELYKLMSRKNITQDQLAAAIGSDSSSLNMVFESDCYCDVRMLGKMFYALGVKCSFVFENI